MVTKLDREKHLQDEREIKQRVISLFSGLCPMPRCNAAAVVCHEIFPRSRGKKALAFENRIALCNSCHEREHHYGASRARIQYLQNIRKFYLLSIGKPEYV